MLEVKHLNAFYGEAQALFDVSFSVPSGSLVLIHGLNGAGKSSLMKSIIGLLPNVQGHISWQGHALMNLPPYQRSEFGLGYVPEDRDRKSTRLNSSHITISYAVFCLKKKNNVMKL